MITLREVVDAVAPLLASFGPSTLGARNVPRNGSPRRWVWVPSTGNPEAAGRADNTLGLRVVTVSVHCWAWDETEAEYMQQALLNAARLALGPGRSAYGGELWPEALDSDRGVIVVTTLILRLPVARRELPLPTPPPAPKPGQVAELSPDVTKTTKATITKETVVPEE